jgi:hypothetical protein
MNLSKMNKPEWRDQSLNKLYMGQEPQITDTIEHGEIKGILLSAKQGVHR